MIGTMKKRDSTRENDRRFKAGIGDWGIDYTEMVGVVLYGCILHCKFLCIKTGHSRQI
jgi:hypothetical protein